MVEKIIKGGLIRMNRIVVLSKFGFKLDSVNSDWIRVDKSLLSSDAFKSLKKGDEITDLTFNDKDFLIGFKIVGSDKASGARDSLQSVSAPKPVKNPQMYGQCVNLAFHSLGDLNLNFQDSNKDYMQIVLGFDIADRIYDEYVKRC